GSAGPACSCRHNPGSLNRDTPTGTWGEPSFPPRPGGEEGPPHVLVLEADLACPGAASQLHADQSACDTLIAQNRCLAHGRTPARRVERLEQSESPEETQRPGGPRLFGRGTKQELYVR